MPCLKSLHSSGTSLEAQGLRLHASNTKVMGSIPDPATKIPHAAWSKKKKKNLYSLWRKVHDLDSEDATVWFHSDFPGESV